MDTMTAFMRGEASRDNDLMVFDWDRAAEMMRDCDAKNASAGLAGDWEWTGGSILEYGKIVPQEDTYTYLASTWATPQLDIDGEIYECYRMEHEVPDWNANTYWPESARRIFES